MSPIHDGIERVGTLGVSVRTFQNPNRNNVWEATTTEKLPSETREGNPVLTAYIGLAPAEFLTEQELIQHMAAIGYIFPKS